MKVDVAANRRQQTWTPREQAGRALWVFGALLFRLIPRPLWSVRNAILRIFGARVGSGVHIHPTVRVEIPWNLEIGDMSAVGDRAILYAIGPIHIGERATISQNAHLCSGTHDYRDPARPVLKRPIHIKSDAWICADAFVSPGVTIGEGAIVGARSFVHKDVDDGCVVSGNPAQVIKRLSEASE